MTTNSCHQKRRGLSTVASALIILVVSILLAGVVTYFAITVVSISVIQHNDPVTDVFKVLDWQIWHGTNQAKVGDNVTISWYINGDYKGSGSFTVSNDTQGEIP